MKRSGETRRAWSHTHRRCGKVSDSLTFRVEMGRAREKSQLENEGTRPVARARAQIRRAKSKCHLALDDAPADTH